MPRLDAFQSKTETTTLAVSGEEITVTYTPGRITGADLEQIGNLDLENKADMSALYNMFAKSVAAWDVTGPLVVAGEELVPEGEPIPVEADYIQHIPIDFLGDVLAAVQEASVQGPKSTKVRQIGRSRRR